MVVEGTTCSGKTTFAKNIIKKLNDYDINALYIKTLPSDTQRGKLIKTSKTKNLELDLLYLDDLYETIKEAQKYLESGKTVIFDRYLPSLLSFCKRYRNSQDYNQLVEILDLKKIKTPDFTFLLYASEKIKSQRMKNKKNISLFDRKSLNDSLLEQYLTEETKKFNPIILCSEQKTEGFDRKP